MAEPAQVCRTAMTDDSVRGGGGAFVPPLGPAELQPGGAERIQVGVFRRPGQLVYPRCLVCLNQGAVVEESFQVLTWHPRRRAWPEVIMPHCSLAAGMMAISAVRLDMEQTCHYCDQRSTSSPVRGACRCT